MISDLIQRLQDILKPYTLDQFIADGNPQDYADVQRLERIWQDYQTKKLFNTCY